MVEEEGVVTLSPNNVRIRKSRAGGKVTFTAHTHNLYQSSQLPTLCILGAHICFFHPPQEGVVFLPNPHLERSEWNYLSWHNQIMAPISLDFHVWHSRSEFQIQIRHWL